MSFSIGDTVGDYRILEEIGRGGMGRVYKVEHTITRRVEAMKVLAGGRPDAPQQAARSLREIQLQASLDHPNIAAVHNAFWAGEDLVLVMELIEGRSLRRALEGGRLPLATTLDYAGQALSALTYAHTNGVIHRDISPGNMMITPAGVLKLTDFGLAKGPSDARLSQSGAPLGSLWYMSPEQVHGSESDARSDIYSLGAVLYEAASGKKPFEGDSAFAIMANQVGKPPAPPIEIDQSLPAVLSAALLRALEKDPDKRFQTAEEFRHVIVGIQSSAGGFQTASRSSARAWVYWCTAAAVCVALIAAGLLATRWRRPPVTIPVVAAVQPAVTVAPAIAPASAQHPPEVPAIPHAKAPKPVARPVLAPTQPVKSGPSRIKKVWRAIWPHSHRDQASSDDSPLPPEASSRQ